jgi:hypothetical protein
MVRFQSEYRRLAAFLWRRLSPRSRLRRAAYILDLGDRVLALGFYRGVIALYGGATKRSSSPSR